MTFLSYAQNFEDVLLWRALHDVERGRYIDIGAQDPEFDSVSFAFYKAGWRGIHVEPTPTYAAKLRDARPDETVVEAAVTDAAGPIAFYELGGLSSGRKDIAQHHEKSGHKPRKIVVPTVGLDNLLELEPGDVHWLKIDVEGMEADVLRSWRDSAVRPWILVVESTFPNSEKPTQHLWIDEVLRRGYEECLFDGLSRFFVHESHADLAERLNRPANVFDDYQITPGHFSAKLTKQEAEERQRSVELRATEQAAHLLELRERLGGTAMDLEAERAAHGALQTRSAEVQARLEGTESALAADRVRIDELAANVSQLTADLSAADEARAGLDSEILKIARLAGEDPSDYAGLTTRLRTVPTGAAYAAVKSRLQVAAKELELLREHAERQYAAGHSARDTEVKFLSDRVSALQAEIADARGRLAQIEAAYATSQNRADSAEKERTRLQLLLDEQTRALESVRADAERLDQQLAGTRQRIASIYGSRGGKFASFLGLLPKTGSAPDSNHQNPPTISGSSPPAQYGMEIAVNDVRHVSNLLALNGVTFVDALYRTLLKRAPDRAGRDHFVGRLQAGHGKEAVLLAIATSKEAQAIGAPIEGVAELQRSQGHKGGWFSRRDRALEERLNRLEYDIGEAHNAVVDRLDRIQNSVDQIQAAMSSGGGFRNEPAQAAGGQNGVRHSIKRGISMAPSASASEFVDSLRREVQSSSEALSLRRS